jgi:transcriptional regulator GlxA family with amidase domain
LAILRSAQSRRWAFAASRSITSSRHRRRRFQAETGLPPRRWLTRQRLDRPRHLLEATDLTVDQIAAEVGFATATSLRQHLHAEIGISPLSYRRTVQATH